MELNFYKLLFFNVARAESPHYALPWNLHHWATFFALNNTFYYSKITDMLLDKDIKKKKKNLSNHFQTMKKVGGGGGGVFSLLIH